MEAGAECCYPTQNSGVAKVKPHELFNLQDDDPVARLEMKVSADSREMLLAVLKNGKCQHATAGKAVADLVAMTARTLFDWVYCGGDEELVTRLRSAMS